MSKQQFPGWLPVQVASHYGFPLGELDGAGQSIAIISLGGELSLDELRKDFNCMRVPFPNLKIVDVNPESITPDQDSGPTDETHLDVEVVGTICSAAKITIYRGANDVGSGFSAAVMAAIDDDNSVISISWGRREFADDYDSDMEMALKKAKRENITVCASVGDGSSSAYRDGQHAIAAPDKCAHVEYPASSPLVLACGGTQVIMAEDGFHEVVWNNAKLKRGVTGGGVSRVFPLPSWQSDNGIAIASANSGDLGRVVPDLSALAAGGDWEIFEGSEVTPAGGTSAVAPLIASLIVLANQKRASKGKSRIGYVNQKLYELGVKDGYFNSVSKGHNRPSKHYPGYDASSGFDACTGWGTPNAATIIDALATQFD